VLIIFIYAAEEIASLFETKIDPNSGIRQPQFGKGNNIGAKYLLERNRREFKQDYQQLRESKRIIESFFQPYAKYQVFIPQNSFFLEKVLRGETPKKVYIGIGFSNEVCSKGERIDLLDFYSWAKRAQKQAGSPELIVWNAACYSVLNELSPELIPKKFSSSSAEQILELLTEDLDKNAAVKENSLLRTRYLRSFLETTEVKGRVIDAAERFKEPKFIAAFQECLEYCYDPESGSIGPSRFVGFGQANSASKLYTPLEMAEAVYLLDTEGIEFKLGPVTEQRFDSFIREVVFQNRQQRYGSIWYTLPPGRKPSYLADSRSINFLDDEAEIEKKLSDLRYRQWLSSVTDPFCGYLEPLPERIVNLKSKIQKGLK